MSDTIDGFRERSLGKTIALFVVTFGLYGLYWLHQLHKELKAEVGADYDPAMRTVGLVVPFYGLYVMWQDSQLLAEAFDKDDTVLFVLWLFLAPIWWFIVQSEVNERAAGA